MIKVTGISWLGIGVDDFSEALEFFRDVLGIRVAVADERGIAMLQIADRQVLEVFGPGTMGKQLTVPPVVAFEVASVASARNELVAQGVELVGELSRWNGFEWQYFIGPGGFKFAVKQTPPDGWEVSTES